MAITTLVTTRRALLAGGAAVVLATVAWSQMTVLPFKGTKIDPTRARELAASGEIILVDIRRPDEWAETGSPEYGHQLDMRRDDFVPALDQLLGGDRSKPVALICARGVRSNRTSEMLKNAGFTHVIDVPEGMLGSIAGPGWLRRKLPVVR